MRFLSILFILFSLNTGAVGFKVFKPSDIKSRKRLSLIVAIHGCKQEAQLFSDITKMTELAEREGAIVLFPEQPRWSNLDRCWNWFLPFIRKQEVQRIYNKVQEIQQRYRVRPKDTLALGLSSGAAMANTLVQCFSSSFGTLAMHSGLMYAAADGISEAQEILLRKEGAYKQPSESAQEAIQCSQENQNTFSYVPTILVVGNKDERLLPIHTTQTKKQLLFQIDFLDDGLFNQSFSLKKEVRKVKSSDSYSYTHTTYKKEKQNYLSVIEVEELGHAWSGGARGFKNSDPLGPSANSLIWSFFNQARK